MKAIPLLMNLRTLNCHRTDMRLTDLLHNQTMTKAKRLAQKGAWSAIIAVDGKVRLSHVRHDTIYLNSREEFNQWIAENGLDEFDVIIVDVAKPQGEKPIEL